MKQYVSTYAIEVEKFFKTVPPYPAMSPRVPARPPEEIDCLYYSAQRKEFVNPNEKHPGNVFLHFERPE